MKYVYDQPGIYAIHIAGQVNTSWSDRLAGMSITYQGERSQEDQLISILYGSLPDQAALFGVLNSLYNARFPILFVRYLRKG